MGDPRSFFSALWSQPSGPHSRLSRYIVANGVLHIAIGATMYLAPAAVLERVFFLPPLSPLEQGLLRALGSVAAIVGWFHVMGGRTRAASFGLATVVDRLLVPVLFVPLWILGLGPPGLVFPFAILDPVLAIGAHLIWRRESA
jgi:hypothetical protein